MIPPAAYKNDASLAHVRLKGTRRRTVSATETVSLRCLSRLATSDTITRKAAGGKDCAMAV